MIIEAILSTVVGSAISGVVGNRVDGIAVDTMNQIINNFNTNRRMINHDLQKAVLTSYYLALKSICEECLEKERGNKRVAPWLECEIEEIQDIMKKIKRNEYNFLLIEQIDDIKLLITTDGSVQQEIDAEKEKLISYALDRDCPPVCYKEQVNNTLYQRTCGFFAFEIKHNQVISNIFQSQLLSNIDIKVTQLSEYLRSGVMSGLPQFNASLEKIEQAMKDNHNSYEEVKELLICIGSSNSDKLDEILRILRENNLRIPQLKSRDEIIKEITNNSKAKLKLMQEKDRIFSRTINYRLLCDVVNKDTDKLYTWEEGKEIPNDQAEGIPIIKAIESYWGRGSKNVVITGEGGMGKTTSLHVIWSYLLEHFEKEILPLYINLSEYNYTQEDFKDTFISYKIKKDYYHNLSLNKDVQNPLIMLLNELISGNEENTRPYVILLLDGLNEITRNQSGLIRELFDIVSHHEKMQVIITTRKIPFGFDMFRNMFYELILTPLCQEKIAQDINAQSNKVYVNTELLSNPMMLCLFTETEKILSCYNGFTDDLVKNITSEGELILNYMLVQKNKVSRFISLCENKLPYILITFAVKQVLPYIGYVMEREDIIRIQEISLKRIIIDFLKKFKGEDASQFFPEYDDYSDELGPGMEDTLSAYRKTANKYIDIIVEFMAVMKQIKSDNSEIYYEFAHQKFRSFFAAYHVCNAFKIFKINKIVPVEIINRAINYGTRKYIGQILGENRKDQADAGQPLKSSYIEEMLELCRFNYHNIGFALWNLLEILISFNRKTVNNDSSYYNLTNLKPDRFNRVYLPCSSNCLAFSNGIFRDIYRETNYGVIKRPFCSDEKRVILASNDNILEYSLSSCNYDRLYEAWGKLTFAEYSLDGSKIVASYRLVTDEFFIVIWDCETGKNVYDILLDFFEEGHCLEIDRIVFHNADENLLVLFDNRILLNVDIRSNEIKTILRNEKGSIHDVFLRSNKEEFIIIIDDKAELWELNTLSRKKEICNFSKASWFISYFEVSDQLLSYGYSDWGRSDFAFIIDVNSGNTKIDYLD